MSPNSSNLVPLQDFINGSLYRKGMYIFEAALNPYIKKLMKEHFPTTDPNDEYTVFQRSWASCHEELEKQFQAVKDELYSAQDEMKKASDFDTKQGDSESRRIFGIAKGKAGKLKRELRNSQKQLDDHDGKARAGPQVRWVRECHKGFANDVMRRFVTADAHFDTYSIAAIMRYHLREVFAPNLLNNDVFEAKVLLQKLLFASEMHTRRAHMAPPSEAEVLDALEDLKATLLQCGLNNAAQEISDTIKIIQALVDKAFKVIGNDAMSAASEMTTQLVSVAEWEALVLYLALNEFETRLNCQLRPKSEISELETQNISNIEICSDDANDNDDTVAQDTRYESFYYQDGTIAFGAVVNTWNDAQRKVVRQARKDLRTVAIARHWLYQNTNAELSVPHCLETMGKLLQSFKILGREVGAPADREVAPGWQFPEILKAGINTSHTDAHLSVCVNVSLQLSGRGMSVPFPRDPLFVGREDLQRQLCEAILLPPSAGPVLVHGLPGVGKDTLLSETVRLPKIAQCPEIVLAMWLQGSTNVSFCHQLVVKFRVHRPKVVSSAKSQEEALSAIREWLLNNKGWLMAIEDVTMECEGVWKYVPMGCGRVVITSQELLKDIPHERIVTVLPFRTADSLKLLHKMRLFDRRPFKQESSVSFGDTGIWNSDWGEGKWKAACEETSGAVRYKAFVTGEKSKAQKQRYREMYSQLLEYYELRTPGLKEFLEEDLGNLPLSVKLIGNLLRAGSQDVGKLMEDFGSAKESNALQLSDAESRARHPRDDRHYTGFVISVCITVQRMLSSCEDDTDLRDSICELLLLMSVLHRTRTPCDLFQQNERNLASNNVSDNVCRLFQDDGDDSFEEARKRLRHYGLLTGGDDVFVGNMHQGVHKLLREEVLKPSLLSDTAVVADTPSINYGLATKGEQDGRDDVSPFVGPSGLVELFRRSNDISWVSLLMEQLMLVLQDTYEFLDKERGDEAVLQRLRKWTPSVQSLVEVFTEPWCPELYCYPVFDLCQELHSVLLQHYGNAKSALPYAQKMEIFARSKLHGDESVKIASMTSLATTYSHLGQHDDALELQEDTLAICKRVLPANHHGNATSMNNLANTYSHLGRHDEALKLRVETLAFRKHVLSANHPNIATSMSNLANSYSDLGRYDEALKLQEETLVFRKRVLRANHPDIAMSMSNIANSYSALGRHIDALELKKETLAFCTHVLPAKHHFIATSMGNLANSYSDLGLHDEALELKENTLELLKRALPANHPDIGTSMGNLANSYSALGRHDDALMLQEKTLVLLERVLPANHPDIATNMSNLGISYSDLGRHDEALKLKKETLALRKRVLPANHADIATSMNSLANSYSALGRHGDALNLLEEALAFRKRVLRANHPDIATSMKSLANSYSALGRHNDALKLQENILAFRKLKLTE